MENLKNIRGDKAVWAVAVLLSIYSILGVYSATGSLAYGKAGNNAEFYMLKQGIILLLGFGLMYVTQLIPYRKFSKASFLGILIALPLLIYTFIEGASVNSARRWIEIPFTNLTFQSSDVAKIVLITFLAYLLQKKLPQRLNFKVGFLPLLIPVGITCLLILPSNFSTAFIIFVVCLVMMFVGKVRLRYLALLIATGILFFGLVILIGVKFPKTMPRAATWANRLSSWVSTETISEKVNSDDHLQSEQAKIAIATGGITGKLPGKSTQRNFLPSAFSDFIFAIIIEEYGLILGGILLILLYIILLFRGIRIALKSDTPFGAILAAGITFSLVFQAMVNMIVAVGIGPVTGQTLPMISMGGTSIWFTCISLGMLQSIARGATQIPLPETDPQVIEETDEQYQEGVPA